MTDDADPNPAVPEHPQSGTPARAGASLSVAPPPGSSGRAAVRLLQGYLWYPQESDLDLESFLPSELDEAHLLWDRVNPPFAFFENGLPTSDQAFYQFTVLEVFEERPDAAALHRKAQHISEVLGPLLEATPEGVGWQLWEDLRDL